MEIYINIYGPVRHIIGETAFQLSVPAGATVKEALKHLADKLGDRFRDVIFDSKGRLNNSVKVFVNDQECDLAHRLKEEDAKQMRLFIMSAVAGGSK